MRDRFTRRRRDATRRCIHDQRARATRIGCWLAPLLCARRAAAFAPARARTSPVATRRQVDCPQLAAAAETARGIALGTGLRASAISTSALAYSPAALALGNLYHIEGEHRLHRPRSTPSRSALRSSTRRRASVGAGIGAARLSLRRRRLRHRRGLRLRRLDGRVGIALALSEAFSLGVSGATSTSRASDDRRRR